MPEFEIVKKTDGGFRGYTQDDQKAYLKWRSKMEGMEPGEFAKVKVTFPRSVPFHRKFMKMVRFAFEQWEPEKSRKRLKYKGMVIHKDFDKFREDMVILAGYGVAKFDARGRVTIEAQSLAFENMEDETFVKVYAAVYEAIYQNIFVAKGYTREDLTGALAVFEHFQPT